MILKGPKNAQGRAICKRVRKPIEGKELRPIGKTAFWTSDDRHMHGDVDVPTVKYNTG